MAGERHGHGIGMAWTRNAICESALKMMLAFRFTRHLKWHRWMNTLPRHSKTCYCSVLCINITITYRLYPFWLVIKCNKTNSRVTFPLLVLNIDRLPYETFRIPTDYHSTSGTHSTSFMSHWPYIFFNRRAPINKTHEINLLRNFLGLRIPNLVTPHEYMWYCLGLICSWIPQ